MAKRRASKIFSSDDQAAINYPKASVSKKFVKRSDLTGLKPERASAGSRRSRLLDQYGNPLERRPAYEVNLHGVPNASAADGINRDASAFGGSGSSSGSGHESMIGGSREWYDFRTTPTFLQLPTQEQFRELNFLRRAIYLRDEIVGAGLDMISDMIFGKGTFVHDDEGVIRLFEEAADATGVIDFMSRLTLHYLIHGEVIPWCWWDDTKGYWTYLYSIDPNDIEIASMPYSHSGDVIVLKPTSGVQHVLSNTKPEYRVLQDNMPDQFLQQLKENRPVILNPRNATYLLRENFALQDTFGYTVRGQSIIDRIFRIWIYYEKIMEAEMAIADNYIYPVNIIKLGDENWQPSQDDMSNMASMIEESKFDIRPFIVYHSGIELDRIEYTGTFTDLTDRNERLDDLKLIALGIARDMLFGEATLASSRTEMQILVMRLATLKYKMENKWLVPKYLEPIAEAHELYSTTTARRKHNIKVRNYKTVHFRDPENPRSGRMYSERVLDRQLDVPSIMWETRLHSTADADYIDQLKEAFEMDRDPSTGYIAPSTFLKAIGLTFEEEMRRKKADSDLEKEIMEPASEEDENGSLFGKLAVKLGLKDQTSKLDMGAISKFLADENSKLKRYGIHENLSNSLFSGMSNKRRGNLSEAVILPGSGEGDSAQQEAVKFDDQLNLITRFTENLKDHVRLSEQTIHDLVDECAGSEDFLEALLERFELSVPDFFEFVYDEGKRTIYGGLSRERVKKIRQKSGHVDDGYESSRFGGTISNFEDVDVLEGLKQSFRDDIKSLNQDMVKEIEKRLKKDVIDGHPDKATDQVMRDTTKDMDRDVRTEVHKRQKWKVRRIMRTSFANAYNLAIILGLKEQGYEKFRWRIGETDACPICRSLNKKQFKIEGFLSKHKHQWSRASHPNCMCYPELVKSARSSSQKENWKIEELETLVQALGDKALSFELCAKVNSHPEFVKRSKGFNGNVSAALVPKKVLIDKNAASYARLYIAALAERDFKFKYVSDMSNTTRLKFPSFKKRQLSGLVAYGLLEYDELNYRFSSEFLQDSRHHVGNDDVDRLLEAREYATRWSNDGDPIYDGTQVLQYDGVNSKRFFARAYEAYFFDNDTLRRNNPDAWRWIRQRYGTLKNIVGKLEL